MDDASHTFEEVNESAGASFDWRRYLYAILDRLWIVGLAALIGLLVAVFYLRTQETVFRARAVLVFDPDSERILTDVQSVRDMQIRSVEMLNTVLENLRSYPFALRVAERLDLANDADFAAAVQAEGTLTAPRAAGYLSGMVSIVPRRNTRLVDIFVTSRSGPVATKLANGYAEEYLRLLIEQNTEATVSAGRFLVDEAERLGEKLRRSEEALQSFRERERAASFENMLSEAQSRVADIAQELRQTEASLAQVEADISAAESRDDEAALLALPSIAADSRLQSLNEKIAQQEADLELLSQRYLSGHPAFATAQGWLEVAKSDRSEILETVIAELQTRRNTVAGRAEDLRSELAKAQGKLLEVTGKSVEYNTLVRERETDLALHAAVFERLKEVDLTKGIVDDSIRIQEPALGAGPVPVPVPQTLLLGLAAGLALGIGLCLLLDALDPSIRTVEHAERVTGVKVITAFPNISSDKPGLITQTERHGMIAEGFRTLRTAIALLGPRNSRHIFLVTSALPSEGKTFTSSNFATSLAQQGFRTLLIDCDLRKPAISKLFFGSNRKPGLSEVLLGHNDFQECLQPSDVENLTVMTAGGRSENPAELLAGPRIEKLFERARAEFDRIVLDTAPVVAVSDALLLTRFADANFLVVRMNKSQQASIKHAIRLIEEAGCPPSGLVLNRLKSGRLGDRYSYYYYSGRTYGNYGSNGVYGGLSDSASQPLEAAQNR